MPDAYSNEVMTHFCQRVLNGSFNDVKEIFQSDPSDFNINYVVPDNFKEIQGLTALQIALWYQKYDIAKYLIEECHADVNAQGADGITPLYIAVNSLNETWVDTLLTLGAKANIEVRLELQPLEQLKYIFNSGPQYYHKKTLTSICKKLIKKGADISKMNDVSFLATCNLISTTQSTTADFNTLDHENSVTAEWPEPKNDITNTILVDNRISGTVNFNNLIDTMASVEPWVRAVSSIGILTGIIGLFWFLLKKRGSGSNKQCSNIELIERNPRGLFTNEANTYDIQVLLPDPRLLEKVYLGSNK